MRVIANIAINEQAGVSIANRPDIFDILLRILDSKDLSCEELIIDTIVTINNLSFYNSEIIVNNAQDLIDSNFKKFLTDFPFSLTLNSASTRPHAFPTLQQLRRHPGGVPSLRQSVAASRHPQLSHLQKSQQASDRLSQLEQPRASLHRHRRPHKHHDRPGEPAHA